MKPLVSVIITCYNYGDYVADAIESVLNQTYTKIELIVIDDGSTDSSQKVIEKYKDNPKVRIVSRKNKGVIYTRNQGVRLSTGVYVMQLDADDTLEPTYVEECVQKAEQEKLDIVYTQTRIFGRVEFVSEHPKFNLERLKHHGYIHASSLVRKARMKEDPYDTYLDKLGNEDWDMFLDMCLDGSKAGLINKPLLNYRKHVNRKSRADEFEGLYKESLVRHHIWSKQNAKHPDQFWYFSTEIQYLLETIHLYEKNIQLEREVESYLNEKNKLRKRIQHLESRGLIYKLKKLFNK